MMDRARTIEWVDDRIVLLDQTRLPGEEQLLRMETVDGLIDAIRRLAVRGAPALGAAGALGVLLAVHEASRRGWDDAALHDAIKRLRDARPTAVNLARCVDRVAARLPDGAAAVHDEALAVLAEDGAANRAMGEAGARLLLVYAGETWPLLQGSRLTAWELAGLGADYRLVVDGAGAGVIVRGLVDAVVVGADRIAANGDVVNKVGTFPGDSAARPRRPHPHDHDRPAFYLRAMTALPYVRPGSSEAADAVGRAIADGADVALLQHHGCLVVADSAALAFSRAVNLEAAALATYRVRLLGVAPPGCPSDYVEHMRAEEAAGRRYGPRPSAP